MRLRGITRNVVALGWVSFLTDLASEMLYPVMPLFLVNTLGSSPALLGLIDGLAEGISTSLRWIGGVWSDRSGRRKPFIFWGYTVSAFSKPVMGMAAFALGWPLFLLGRCSDRLGKSVRTAARDALIADSTEPDYRGTAFGLHRAMDTCGAVLGPLAALALLVLFPGISLAWLFFAALAPGALSATLAAMAVREIPRPAQPGAKPPRLLQSFPRAYWHVLFGFGLFSLGNSSDAFLILRSSEVGLSFNRTILAFALYNTVYAVAAMPLGRLSDRTGRKSTIMAGFATYAAVYAGFAWFQSPHAPWFLFAAYGLYQAFTEGVSKALITDVVPGHQRAGAIGLFATITGLGQLVASVSAGLLWNFRLLDGHVMPAFALGAVCALAAIPVLATVPRHRPDQT